MKKNIINSETHGFRLPGDYFKSLEEKVMRQIELENKTADKNPFRTPESYFDGVEDKVFAKLSAETGQPKVISIFRSSFFKYAASVAAIAVLFFTVFSLQSKQEQLSFESIEYSSVSQYIEQGYINISAYDLEALISVEKINFSETDLSDSEILDYLSDNINHSELIFEE